MNRTKKVIPQSHSVNPNLASRAIRVVLVGVGGNGSRVLHGLAQLHLALIALGHPCGIWVTSYDPDIVSSANVGRTVFSAADVGIHKATVLTHRINCAYGLDWEAEPRNYESIYWNHGVLITCVDSAKSRRDIFNMVNKNGNRPFCYWLDLGNSQKTGQVILGEFQRQSKVTARGGNPENGFQLSKSPPRLPHVIDLFPELLDESIPESNDPSCSLQEAIGSQDLFVNAHVATWALQLLWELLRNATIERHGYFINLETGTARPLLVESSLKMCFGGKG